MEVMELIERLGKKLPRFPDGRIDYSKSRIAPVITVFVKYKEKILLIKRSGKVGTYKGKWHTVAGYLDEVKPVREKVLEELREEIGIVSGIRSIRIEKSFEVKDRVIGKTWIVHPVLVELEGEPKIKLDWEHTEFRWIKPGNLKNFDTIPGIHKTLEKLF